MICVCVQKLVKNVWPRFRLLSFSILWDTPSSAGGSIELRVQCDMDITAKRWQIAGLEQSFLAKVLESHTDGLSIFNDIIPGAPIICLLAELRI